jgi:putative membrane protein
MVVKVRPRNMKSIAIYFGYALLGIVSATAASTSDQIFVNEAARGGKMEVELGKLAQKNGSNPEVKAFGTQMITDHTRLNNELDSVAKAGGLSVPTDLNSQQKAEFQDLSKAFDKSFDRRYADLMVKDHTDDLAAFQKAETDTKDKQLKKAIADAIPVIQHHLHMAKSMADKVKGR